MAEVNKMTPTMKAILESLSESPKTDSKLLEAIPNFSSDILGKLRELDAIDHHGHIVYITSIGQSLLESANSNK